MAMDGEKMGEAVAEKIVSADASTEIKKQVMKTWVEICTEIVNHIKENAEVPAGIQVKTSGTAVSQAGDTISEGKVI